MRKPDCLLLHGWGLTSRVWESFSESIGAVEQIKAPCLYHAASETNDHKLESIAAILKEEINNETIIVAWSLGGVVATILAGLTDKIKGIVFIASTPCFANKPDWKNVLDPAAIKNLKQQLIKAPQQTINSFAGLIAHGEPEQKRVTRELQQSLANAKEKTVLATWLDELLQQDLREEVSELTIPSLFILAENDALIKPQLKEQIKQLQPKAACSLINNAGHAPFISRPEEVVRQINEFINEQHK